jgi:hypothetical protein
MHQFLRRVLPPTGVYVAAHRMAVQKPDEHGRWRDVVGEDGGPVITFHHKAFDSIDDLEVFLRNRDGAAVSQRRPTACGNVWFAPASFKEKRPVRPGKQGEPPRAQHARAECNVAHIGALWLDLDVEDGNPRKYATLGQAGAGLKTFLRSKAAAPFGEPDLIVRSGGGMHAYWTLTEPLTVPEWRLLNGDFTAALRKVGIPHDKGVVSNPATLLRPVGTHNFKYDPPRPVEALFVKD